LSWKLLHLPLGETNAGVPRCRADVSVPKDSLTIMQDAEAGLAVKEIEKVILLQSEKLFS
jgi:hypothetical protein